MCDLSYSKYESYKNIVMYCSLVLKKFLSGYCFAKNILYLFVKSNAFISLVSFAKYNLVLGFDALLDIAVVDYPSRLRRFELNYVFLSYKLEHRIILKISSVNRKSVYSINNLYPSSN